MMLHQKEVVNNVYKRGVLKEGMKKRLVIGFVLGLIFLLGAVSAGVFVNEVETNPIDETEEYVELYNSEIFEVNISGWLIIDSRGRVDTIPTETIIPAQGFFVFDETISLLDFKNNDSITLRDDMSVYVDSTLFLEDGDNDDSTWSRVPDGTGAFVFQQSTKGITNIIPMATLQDEIDAASSGDTIVVAADTYVEDLFIDKRLTLRGADVDTTIIDGTITIVSSNVKLDGLTFKAHGSTAIILDSSSSLISNVDVTDSIFDLSVSPAVGIYVGGGSPTELTSNIDIKNNVFNGPADKNCNPWKVGGWFGTPISAEVKNLKFEHNVVNSCSIPINLQDEDLDDFYINNNTFRDTDGVLYIWADVGSDPTGELSDFVFMNNDIDSSNSYGVGIDVFGDIFKDDNFGTGNRFTENSFVGIPGAHGFDALTTLANLTSYEFNAEGNYWGACDGPAPGYVSDHVDASSWIGACVGGLDELPACILPSDDVTLYANVLGDYCVGDVIFSVFLGGEWRNFTGVSTSQPFALGNYGVVLSSAETDEGTTIDYKVYVDDCFGHSEESGIGSFDVLTRTVVIPSFAPDGLNGWYKTEPTFTLSNSDATDMYYYWDAGVTNTYVLPFDLGSAPNNANVTGGIIDLNFWADLSCGVEDTITEMFRFDFEDLSIEDIVPVQDAIIPAASDVLISAYIDEVYGGNSGVNLATVDLAIDDDLKAATVEAANSQDAEVSFLAVGLLPGRHEVRVTAEDNAGRFSQRTWDFIVSEIPDYELTVHSDLTGVFSERRIPLEITTTLKSESIEIIDYSDNRPRWRKLCRKCDEYGSEKRRLKTFKDGEHNITIRGTGMLGQEDEASFFFRVDSKDPRIRSTLPRRGFASGVFEVSFREENPVELVLHYGTEGDMRFSLVDFASCVEERSKTVCEEEVNLTDYHGQEIDYWFDLVDIAGNSDESRVRTLDVDVVDPEILFSGFEVNKRRVSFTYQIDEDNFDKILYMDNNATRPRFRTLCSRLDEDGICKKRTSFKTGEHYLTVRVQDDAGNFVEEEVGFVI